MKFRQTSRAFIAAAALLAALAAAPGAKAFTIENQGGPGGGHGFADMDKPASPPDRLAPVSPFNSDSGQTTMRQGNTTLQFGQQRSFNERYNTNNIFDPYTRDGR